MKRLMQVSGLLAVTGLASAALAQPADNPPANAAGGPPTATQPTAAQKIGEDAKSQATDIGAAGQQRAGEAQGEAKRKMEEGKGKAADATAEARERLTAATQGTGQGDEQAVTQLEREEAKHRERVARLEAVRDKLTEGGNTTAAARVDQALEKEDARYERSLQRLKAKDEKASQRFEQKMQKVRDRDAAKGEHQKGGPQDEKGKGHDKK